MYRSQLSYHPRGLRPSLCLACVYAHLANHILIALPRQAFDVSLSNLTNTSLVFSNCNTAALICNAKLQIVLKSGHGKNEN